VVDNLMARTFRNLLARPALAAEIITNSELLPGLLDLADAVTDIALGNAGKVVVIDVLGWIAVTMRVVFALCLLQTARMIVVCEC
jgi:hypothetical protein